jgi:succinylarginine dihydrolase
MLNEAKADQLESVIAANWPEQIDPADLGSDTLKNSVRSARYALLEALDLTELG